MSTRLKQNQIFFYRRFFFQFTFPALWITNETGERKQNIDSWHLVFSSIKSWKSCRNLFLLHKQYCIPYFVCRVRKCRENAIYAWFICHYLTIKFLTSAWLACSFIINNYFLMRPLSDLQNMPVSSETITIYNSLKSQSYDSDRLIAHQQFLGTCRGSRTSKNFRLIKLLFSNTQIPPPPRPTPPPPHLQHPGKSLQACRRRQDTSYYWKII